MGTQNHHGQWGCGSLIDGTAWNRRTIIRRTKYMTVDAVAEFALPRKTCTVMAHGRSPWQPYFTSLVSLQMPRTRTSHTPSCHCAHASTAHRARTSLYMSPITATQPDFRGPSSDGPGCFDGCSEVQMQSISRTLTRTRRARRKVREAKQQGFADALTRSPVSATR